MTSQEQRVAIAEHCGWKVIQNGLGSTIIMREAAPDEWHIVDPLSDLNAVHEAEKTLDPHLRNNFIAHLWKITGNEPSVNFWSEYNFRGLYACIHATASQRAEAFLRTIGKYKSQ